MSLILRLKQEITDDERMEGASLCFIAHEFNEDLRDNLRTALNEIALKAYFADNDVIGGSILEKVCRKILVARACIVDLSTSNAEVYFELGLAIGLNKPVFVLLKRRAKVPRLLENFVKVRFSSYNKMEQELKAGMPEWLKMSDENDARYHNHCQFVNTNCEHRCRISPHQQYLVGDQVIDTDDRGDEIIGCDDDFRRQLPVALNRFDFTPIYLHEVQLEDGLELCGYCRTLRDCKFALYHLTSNTSPSVYLLMGLSMGLGIPGLLIKDENCNDRGEPLVKLPPLLQGQDYFPYKSKKSIGEALGAKVLGFLNELQGKPIKLGPLLMRDAQRKEEPREGDDDGYSSGADLGSLPADVVEAARGGYLILIAGELTKKKIAGAPTRKEMARRLSQTFKVQAGRSFEQAASLVESEFGREALVSFVRKELEAARRRPVGVYRIIGQLPIRTIITTNYDDLIEDSLRRESKDLSVIWDTSTRISRMLNTVEIFKLAGDPAHPESLLLTEQDADKLSGERHLISLLRDIASELIARPTLMLGQDLNQRVFNRFLETVSRFAPRGMLNIYADSASLSAWNIAPDGIRAGFNGLDATPEAILRLLAESLAEREPEPDYDHLPPDLPDEREQKSSVFISCHPSDRGWVVDSLGPYLRRAQLHTNFGDDNTVTMRVNPQYDRRVLLVLTPDYFQHKTTLYELDHILTVIERDRIIPIMLRETVLPPSIADLSSRVIDLSGTTDFTPVINAIMAGEMIDAYNRNQVDASEGDPGDSKDSPTLAPGTLLLDRYQIIKRVGGGGMGSVYQARDRRLDDRVCAVKEMIELFASASQRAKAIEDFKREAEVMAQLEHPSIPVFFDYFIEGSKYYIVMKWIGGGDLLEQIQRRGGAVDEVTVTRWAIQLCDVLHYIHSQKPPIIYRDLKPANVMLDNNGRVTLVDFGIARVVRPTERGVTAIGTMGYAPPELYAGKVEPRSDIYSLGATMFQMLTGIDPQDNPLLIFDLNKNPMPRQINPGITPEMEQILVKAVAHKPEDRFESARVMGEELKKHLNMLESPSKKS